MLKKLKIFGIQGIVLSAILLGAVFVPFNAQAATCSNSSNYGTVTKSVSVPVTGEYRIWSRIKVPSNASSTYQLEANSNTCWQVGGNNIALPPNQWTWVDWYGGNTSQKVNYTFSTGAQNLKLIGAVAGVQVDKVILLGPEEKCSDGGTTPIGDGANCAKAPDAATSGSNNGSVTATTGQQVVAAQANDTITKGELVALDTSIVTDPAKAASVQKVEFYNNEELIQTVTEPPFVLDTNKLTAGSYNITQRTYFKDGTIGTQTQLIEVKGASDVQSAIATTSTQSKKSPLLAILVACVLFALLAVVCAWYFVYRKMGYTFSESIKVICSAPRKLFARSATSVPAEPHADIDATYYAEPTVIQPNIKDQNK